MSERPTLVGVLGGHARASVGPRGRIAPDDAAWQLDWWIGADDRWRMPTRETAVRQVLIGDTPVVQTAMRVPGGDAIQRVYGVGGASEAVVVEVANESPAPFVAAFVVQGARSIAFEGPVAFVDGRAALVGSRPPSRWSVGDATEIEVCSGAARSGPFPGARDRAGRLEAAFLHPVPHRTAIRVLLPGAAATDADPARVPTADDAVRGWRAQLDRGMRVDVPDDRLAEATRAALGQALLAAGARNPNGSDVAALEDWGFDDEAADGWRRLSGRERRRSARRLPHGATWGEVLDALGRGGAELLLTVRGFLAHESDDGTVTLLPELPHEWLGQRVDVHEAPTRRGPVSYAVRWHGPRPALLWDAAPGLTLRAPGLDAQWTTSEPHGEALLRGAAA